MKQTQIIGILWCWSKKNIDSTIQPGKKKKALVERSSEMCKFSAEGKYSGDRQGDERKYGQLAGVAADSSHSPCGPQRGLR